MMKREEVVEKTGAQGESYDYFTAAMPENDCRYAYDFVTEDNCQKSKIFFIAWAPSTSPIRAKMLYATSNNRFRCELDGIHYEIGAEWVLSSYYMLSKLLLKQWSTR